MKDIRIEKMADVLVNYSTKVRKGEIVQIKAYGTATEPLLKEVYRLCLQKGAKYVDSRLVVPELGRTFYNNATDEQLAYFPQHELDFMKKVDVYIGIAAVENSMHLSRAKQDSVVAYDKVMRPILDERVKNSRWVICRYPTEGSAQDAKMSLEEYEDFLFSACNIDWEAESAKQERLKRMMDATDSVRIVASDTDISFSIKGIKAMKCDGHHNIPDGEVYTAPVRDSVEGFISYNCPSVYQGKEFNNVRLKFEKGMVVEATSPGMDEALNKVLDTDEGARYIGEFAIGVNPNITEPMRNILFDEKIFGSIHLTPGQCYEECDNGNKSAVHWDLVKILTDDGEIYFDGVLIQKDGLFVHDGLLGLNPV
ncbi:MAG: aminopeptidase [Proteobacteria bacterium]|nr:aminopeptidase [Pseudomonadota bacterium]